MLSYCDTALPYSQQTFQWIAGFHSEIPTAARHLLVDHQSAGTLLSLEWKKMFEGNKWNLIWLSQKRSKYVNISYNSIMKIVFEVFKLPVKAGTLVSSSFIAVLKAFMASRILPWKINWFPTCQANSSEQLGNYMTNRGKGKERKKEGEALWWNISGEDG